MYELIQVSEHCYYIQSPAKIGFAWLNDTGRLSVQFKDNLLLWVRKE